MFRFIIGESNARTLFILVLPRMRRVEKESSFRHYRVFEYKLGNGCLDKKCVSSHLLER